MKDYYTVLGIKSTASPAQIDAAYRGLMQKYHLNVRATQQGLDRMRELNEAWRVLSDPAQRAAYDRARAEGAGYQPPTAATTLRAAPPSAVAEFGAPRRKGGSCLVRFVVVLVFLFAVGVFLWGLNQHVDFAAWWENTQTEISAFLPLPAVNQTSLALADVTPTPDPRCRDGCETPPPGCVVKGDIETGGERFFYLPNDEGYGNVRVEIAKGDRWFCALTDAQAAGWTRKAPTETPPPTLPPEAFTTSIARRTLIVCADNAALFQGPGEEYPQLSAVANGGRVAVTGVNGEWWVVNTENGAAYVQAAVLCTPTRRPQPATTAASASSATETPTVLAANTSVASPAHAFKYPAPQLLEPTNGARYWCTRDLIFKWTLDAPALAPDEYFLVESKPHERERWTALADWTKSMTVTLSPNRGGGSCETVWWSNTGAYQWRVSVVRGNKEMPEYLSPFAVYDIIYAQ